MRQKKYRKPDGYRPPTNAQALMDRYQEGERYFECARLQDAILAGCRLENVNLSGADLRRAYAADAVFIGVDFTDTSCAGMVFDRAQLFRCSFARADLRNVSLYMTRLSFGSFFGAQMEDARFLDCLQARDDDRARLGSSRSQEASCFVSYSSADQVPGDLAQALHRADIPHWYMPRSSWFDSYVSENLARVIDLCDVFVFVLSDNALKSRWVQGEVTCALRLRNKTGAPRIVILRTDQTQLPETGPFSPLSDYEFIDCSDRTQGIDELVGLLTRSKMSG